MGYQARFRALGGDDYAAFGQVGAQRFQVFGARGDEDHVGFGCVDLEALAGGQTLGQSLCVGMVLGQPVDMVVQRVKAGGRQYSGLPKWKLAPK